MTPPARPTPHARADDARKRTLLIAGAATAVVVILGVVIALAGGKDDPTSTTGTGDAAPAYGPVSLDGQALPPFESTSGDAAAGQAAPHLGGTSPDGAPVTVGGAGRPTLVAFLAHWCPHCQRELPVLVDLMAQGKLEGTRVVAVLTGTSPDRPNFPPVAWLQREGWKGEVILDDDASAAAQGFGLSSYPFLVFLDDTGAVVARASGELPGEDIVALARQAR